MTICAECKHVRRGRFQQAVDWKCGANPKEPLPVSGFVNHAYCTDVNLYGTCAKYEPKPPSWFRSFVEWVKGEER